MTTPKVTVVSTAFRPGGIDVLLAGLRDQSFQDFNVVISDRRYELRHDRVVELARSYGFDSSRLLHVPEHRRNGKWTSFCLPPGQPIRTWGGLIPIEDVRKHSFVLGHSGQFRRVKDTMQRPYSGEMVCIQANGDASTLKLTPDHEVLVAPMARTGDGGRAPRISGELQWTPAGQIQPGMALAFPVPVESVVERPLYLFVPRSKLISAAVDMCSPGADSLLRLMGWFLAEGHVNPKGTVTLTLGGDETKEVEEIKSDAASCGYSASAWHFKQGNAWRVTISSKGFAAFVAAEFGRGARNKRIPAWAYTLPKARAAALLGAYLKGDGHETGEKNYHPVGYIRATTVSRTLAYDLVLLGSRAGYTCSVGGPYKSSSVIQGRTVNAADHYEVQFNPRSAKIGNRRWRDEHHVYSIVTAVSRETYTGPVYNLSVDADESYCTAMHAVHNCAGWNSAFALATGELVVMLQEWAYARPDWLASHVRAHEKAAAAGSRSVYILSPYVYTAMPPLKLLQPFDFTGQRSRGDRCVEADAILTGGVLDELSAFEGGLFDPAWIKGLRLYGKPDQDTRAASPGSKVPDTWVHIKNESIRRDLLWEMNGLDERMERGKGPMDLDFGIRLTNGRVPLIWNPGAICIVPDPRWIVRTMPWGDMTERLEGRWSYNDGLVYNARRKKDGLTVAQNLYTMPALAARLSGWRDETKHPVVPRDVDDATYWGRDIWPDSE